MYFRLLSLLIVLCLTTATSFSQVNPAEHRGEPDNTHPDITVAPVSTIPTVTDALQNAAATTGPQMRVPGSNVILTAVCLGNDGSGDTDYFVPGFYRVEAKAAGETSLLAADSELSQMYTGFASGSRYYALIRPDQGERVVQNTYNTEDFSLIERTEIDPAQAPQVTFVHPTTGKVYAFLPNSITGQPSLYSAYYPQLGYSTPICEFAKYVNAAAFFNDHQFYAVCDRNGTLVCVNAESGAVTEIGCSYIYPGKYNSLIFEPISGKLFWLLQTSTGKNILYEMNTETAAGTKLCEFNNATVFTGAYAQPYCIPSDALAKVKDITVRMVSPSSLTGTVAFTAPNSLISGEPVSEYMSVAVYLNNRITEIRNIAPGQRVTTGTLTFQPGENEVTILAYMNNIRGEESHLNPWAGTDIPAAPYNVTLTSENDKPRLKWIVPEKGVHGGNAETENITYRIVRQPSGTVFNIGNATEWTDLSYSEPYAVWYKIYAVNSAGSSAPGVSNRLTCSYPFAIPFNETFATEEDFRLWSGHADNNSPYWTYSASQKAAVLKLTHETGADAWLISPSMELEGGKTYSLSYTAQPISEEYPEEFSIALGTGEMPDDFNTVLCQHSMYSLGENGSYTVLFTPEHSGEYHLGVHCTSGTEGWGMIMEQIGVNAHDSGAPAAVIDASIKPYTKDNLLLEFVVPSTTVSGDRLTQHLTATIIDEASQSVPTELPDLAPGAHIRHIISTNTTGIHKYQIYCSIGNSDGPGTSLSAFSGIDVPAAVSDITAVESEHHTVTVSWSRPQTGAHGGYCAPDELCYTVIRSDGKTVACEIQGEAAEDELENAQSQTLYYYVVIPQNSAGAGPLNISEPAPYGQSLPTPYTEGFAQCGNSTTGWYAPESGTGAEWVFMTSGSNPPVADFDSNMGLLAYHVTNAQIQAGAMVQSPYLDLSGLQHPVLNFYVHTDTHGGIPDLKVTASSEQTQNQVLDIKLPDGNDFEWKRVCADLQSLSGAERVRLTFTSHGHADIYIDHITLDESRPRELGVMNLRTPPYMAVNTVADVYVTITNLGDTPSEPTVLELSSPLTEATSQSVPAISPGCSHTITIPVKVTSSGENELTARIGTSVLGCDIITGPRRMGVPVNLAATPDASGNLLLTWDAPLDAPVTCDTFESYTDWAIDNIGPYLTCDRDHSPTYYINKDLDWYPHSTDAKAFQVCNAALLGIDNWSEGKPQVGSKMLMCLSSTDRTNDDWLILPQLNGRHREVSAYIKSFTDISIAPERLRIMVSYTDADPDSFTPLMGNPYIQVPSEWVPVSFTAPEGARYVAFNCVSDHSFALFIDRLEYTDHASDWVTPTGYIIYENGEPVGTASENHFTVTAPEKGKELIYTVAATGPEHLSLPSEPVSIRLSSLSEIRSSGVEIKPMADGVIIKGAVCQINIITPDGTCVYSCVPETPELKITLAAGVYIVSADLCTEKLIIR